jgi:excisionase family DNA binding protein
MTKLAYRLPEAIEISGIGRTKLYELIANGEIQAVHVGRRTLVLGDSLRSFLEGLATVARPSKERGDA